MKYIKLFSTSAEYEAFISGDQFVTPNISFIPTERLAKYSSMPKPKAEPKVTLEYDCPEDNLLAFTCGAENIKKLTVDSKNIEFEPLQNVQGTKEIFASEIVFDMENETVQFPNNYVFSHFPSFIKIKPMDPSYEITNNTAFCMFAYIPMYNMSAPIGSFLIPDGVAMGYIALNDDNSVTFGETFMTDMKPMLDMYGYQITCCLGELGENVNSEIPNFINTTIEFEGLDGGLQTPYLFDTPGHHTVEMVLTDGNFGGFYMFLNAAEEQWAALTSITLNEAVTYIYRGTFVSRSLTHITCEGEIAPILEIVDGDTGINVPYFGTLVYPKRSDYSSWLDVNNGFGMYGWNQEPPVITCTYNVTDISTPTKICNKLSSDDYNYFNSITVDGVLMTNQSTGVTFTTAQKHTVEFTLSDMTIPYNLFNYCDTLINVKMTGTIKTIGDSAFASCSGLTSINIPDSVTEISNTAFDGCNLLKTTIDDIVYVDNCIVGTKNAFNHTTFTIQNNTRKIGNSAFYACTNLTTIDIPDSVTTIGKEAFRGCTRLSSITLGSGVTGIGYAAFSNCKSLTSIVIPDSVTSIERYAFYNCSGLTEVTIGSGVKTIGEYAFQSCLGLTGVTIGSGVTYISYRAFEYCSSLESIVVSSGNTKYDSRENCNCLIETATNKLIAGCKNSVILDSVTSIGEGAFRHCSGLTSITIPDSVTKIDYDAFYGCSGLTSITCYAITAPSIQSDTFCNIKQNGTLYVPVGSDYSSWMSTSSNYLGYYNWTKQLIYTPVTFYNLTITANDVSGRNTNTTIHWSCISDGYSPVDNTPLTGITLTGTTTSEAFPQNTSETETVERTITFEYQGLTASTTITQGVWINQDYTVGLNDQWQLSSEIPNPDSSIYDGVYESFSNKGVDNTAAFMYIDIVGYNNFKFYVRSNAESNYDYVVVSNLDCELTNGTTSGENVKMTTKGKQNSGTAIGNYTLVEFTGIDGGEHRITVMYCKDSSGASGTDRGYVLIPKEQ